MRAKNVRLVPSEKMDEGGAQEHGYIRIPRRARLYFNSRGERLVVTVDKNTKVLHIRPAYRSDLTSLKQQLEAGEIGEEEAKATGFVTTATFQQMTRFVKKETVDKYSFLTDGIEDIKIGGDPEFVLVDPATRRFKYAQQVPGLSLEAQLGHDGPLAEVRPPPEITAEGLVNNIRTIFKRDRNKMEPWLWYGGAAYRAPDQAPNERVVHVGGHIQFGNPLLLPEGQVNSIYKQTVRVLDETVALPLVRIDTPLPAHRRNQFWNGYGRYGRWSDFKPKENRFEWRVPSGLWLTHPDIAQAVLGTSKAVVESCYQMMADKDFDDSWICARADRKGFLKSWGALNARQVEKLINDAEPTAVEIALVNRAAKKLRGLDNYSKYKAEIEEFLRLVRLSDKDKANINLDLKDTWLNNGKLITGGK